MKQESELVSFNIDARTVTLRFDTEETLRLFVAKYVERLAVPSAVSPQMSPPAFECSAGDPRSPGDGGPTMAVVVGSQGGARPGEGGGVIEDDEHRWWTCYHEPTCLSLDAHRRKDEARSHCGRDPSVIGCCGGTDDTCSCECNTCMDPNEPPPRSRSNEARRCHACDQVRADVGELPDTLPLCVQCAKAHRMGYRCGEEAAALEKTDPSDDVLEARVALHDEICTWLEEHGHAVAARDLYERKDGFFLAPCSANPTPVDSITLPLRRTSDKQITCMWILKNMEDRYLSALGFFTKGGDVISEQTYALRFDDRNEAARAAIQSGGVWRVVRLASHGDSKP